MVKSLTALLNSSPKFTTKYFSGQSLKVQKCKQHEQTNGSVHPFLSFRIQIYVFENGFCRVVSFVFHHVWFHALKGTIDPENRLPDPMS